MSKSTPLIIDLTKKEDIAKLNHYKLFAKLYETKLPGQGLFYFRHGACEYQEHSFQQHGIKVYLKPESNSLSKIGNVVKTENAQVGDIAIVPAKVNYWQKIEADVSEGIVFNIEPQIIARMAYESTNSERVELLPTFPKSDPLIYHIALSIKANFDSGNYDQLYVESLFHSLSIHLFRNYTAQKFDLKKYGDGLPSFKLKLAINYINDHLDQTIKLNDIAEILDLSQFYFCHLFKQSTGIAPYKYVIQKRVQRAKKLLSHSKVPLVDIAYECGFSSQSQMTKHFRKCEGMTPKVYRSNFE